MPVSPDPLREEYTIETPEAVTFGYEIVGIGTRFIGALVDVLLVGAGLALLNLILVVLLVWLGDGSFDAVLDLESQATGWAEGLVLALNALLNFGLLWGYFILFELFWNGQTPGKRLARTRVVRLDGSPIGAGEAVIRNLVRLVDFLPVGYGVGVVTMFLNRQTRRLGDFAAGTLVVRDQGALSLASIVAARPPAPPAPLPTAAPTSPTGAALPASVEGWPDVRRLTAADVELVQTTLARYAAGQADLTLVRRVAALIAPKLGPQPSSLYEGAVPPALEMLRAVATALQK